MVMVDNTGAYYNIPWHKVELDGITFKSKLEARWFSFFKQLGINPVYEPRWFPISELVDTPEYIYTPDLELPGMPYPIVEIKPNMRQAGGIINQTIIKLKSISRGGTPTALIAGQCWPGKFDIAFFRDGQNYFPPIGLINKIRFAFGLTWREAESVLVLKMLLNNHKADYLKAFVRSHEVVK